MDRYRIVNGTVTLILANTEYIVTIPLDACEFASRIADATKAWRWSMTTGQVAGGGGFPLAAGESLAFGQTLQRSEIYVACGTAGQTLHYTYLIPARITA